jgi:hypothetical protein
MRRTISSSLPRCFPTCEVRDSMATLMGPFQHQARSSSSLRRRAPVVTASSSTLSMQAGTTRTSWCSTSSTPHSPRKSSPSSSTSLQLMTHGLDWKRCMHQDPRHELCKFACNSPQSRRRISALPTTTEESSASAIRLQPLASVLKTKNSSPTCCAVSALTTIHSSPASPHAPT